MDGLGIKLFNHDENKIVLPSMNRVVEPEENKLISESIEKDIGGDTVKTIRVKEDTEIMDVNFVLDLSNIDQVTNLQKEVIKSLVVKDGNTAVYMYKKQGLIKLGDGEKYTLERLLPLVKHYVFHDKLKIYKNFKKGEPVNEIDTRDITQLRLKL